MIETNQEMLYPNHVRVIRYVYVNNKKRAKED
jgi:hypothetical protein